MLVPMKYASRKAQNIAVLSDTQAYSESEQVPDFSTLLMQ